MLNKIIAALPAEQRGDDYHAACPFCNKEAKPRQTHFSYCERGYHCFVCGEGGGLYALARHLNLIDATPSYNRPRPPRRAPRPRRVLPTFGERLLSTYTAHPDRYEKWLAYRGLRAETVDRFNLGYGQLPGEKFIRSAPGLILPVFNAGACRVLRGRLPAKWITLGGRSLYSPTGKMAADATVMIVENCANACLIAQAMPWIVPLAMTTGAASWNPAWIDALAARRPALVIVAGDADDAGRSMNAKWSKALAARGVLVETLELTEEMEREWILK